MSALGIQRLGSVLGPHYETCNVKSAWLTRIFYGRGFKNLYLTNGCIQKKKLKKYTCLFYNTHSRNEVWWMLMKQNKRLWKYNTLVTKLWKLPPKNCGKGAAQSALY